jgi:ferrous iron transport protein B
MKKIITVALVGNPNTGKSSLFNALTGLKQKTANFPGITVDKHTGYFNVGEKTFIELIDLPGTYSLFPKSKDEVVPFEILSNPKHKNYPQLIIFIGDASNLGRNLILLTQIIDCGLPVILALNMIDLAKAQGIEIDSNKLSEILGIPVIQTNARNNEGVEELKKSLIKQISKPNLTFYNPQIKTEGKLEEVAKLIPHQTEYQLILNINKIINNPDLETNKVIQDAVLKFKSESQMDAGVYQRNDLLFRHKKVKEITTECIDSSHLTRYKERQSKFDKILTHPIYGFLIFFFILFIIFQSIFSWAELPMQWIEALIAFGKEKVRILFGSGILSSLISDGIISGLGGVVTFIPQIAFLFLFITVLDDTGYLPRVAFMMDRFMRKLGLNGKSIIPLISGTACAVPAIMAARNIENTKSRLITILVTPLMSCSARLPVFILLISLFVPNVSLYGLFQLRGLVLFGMYLLGFMALICSAYVFN